MGMGLGAGLSSMAQSYGEGLRLAEVKKQRDKLEKADAKRAEVYIDAMYMDDPKAGKMLKDQLKGWDAADISGWLQGQDDSMRMQAQQNQLALGSLKLQEFEDRLAQDPVMRQAMSDMTMYLSEQNQSPQDALNSTVQANPDLSPESRLKLNTLVQARQTLDFNAQSLQLKTAAAQTDAINAATNASNAKLNRDAFDEGQERRAKGAQLHHIPGVEGSAVVEFPSGQGTRSEIVQTGGDESVDDPRVAGQGDAVMRQAETAYAEADQIATGGGADQVSGDERTIIGRSRYGRLGTQFSRLRQLNAKYRASTGKDHPQYTAFLDNVAPLVQHMRSNKRSEKDIRQMLQSIGFKTTIDQMKAEGRDKEADELAAKFGVDPTK